jgi:sugar lactone lactonase YvrE
VYAVTSAGVVRTIASELGGQPRGLAWDAEDRQLFVAVHDPAAHPRHAIAVVDVPALTPASPTEPSAAP